MKTSKLGAILLIALLLGCSIEAKDTMVFQGVSMLPGIRDGDKLTVSRFDQGSKFEGKRGDVIAFWFPDEPSKSYMKRLIGLPNETIEIREGEVFVNGNKLDEPYVDPKLNRAHVSHPPLIVKEHHYYVLGDNRDSSSDSRIWGLVPEKYIYAKVIPQ